MPGKVLILKDLITSGLATHFVMQKNILKLQEDLIRLSESHSDLIFKNKIEYIKEMEDILNNY
jgi:hypothetical protein